MKKIIYIFFCHGPFSHSRVSRSGSHHSSIVVIGYTAKNIIDVFPFTRIQKKKKSFFDFTQEDKI